jgi:alpha-ketoglutarate-dependent taurine dioxygenase
MSIHVENVKPLFGSILHVEKSQLFEDETVQLSRRLLEDRGVLVFPKVNISDAEQVAFTDRLGTRVNYNAKVPGATDDPDIYKITLDPKENPQPEYVQGTFFWHMDGLNSNIPPPKATVLSARHTAAKGGQTEFASTYLAYETLSDEDKSDFEGLRVTHSVLSNMKRIVDAPSEREIERWSVPPVKQHPLVWKRASGRKSLIIGTTADFIVDMPTPDGRSILARLIEWAAQPDFYYRHEWSEGDLVVWDNTGTLHRVRPYDRRSGRMMHRTTIAGHEEVA